MSLTIGVSEWTKGQVPKNLKGMTKKLLDKFSEVSKENQFLKERCELLEANIKSKDDVIEDAGKFIRKLTDIESKYEGIQKVVEAQDALIKKLQDRLDSNQYNLQKAQLENKAMEDSLRIIKTVVNSHCFDGEDKRGEEWANEK